MTEWSYFVEVLGGGVSLEIEIGLDEEEINLFL